MNEEYAPAAIFSSVLTLKSFYLVEWQSAYIIFTFAYSIKLKHNNKCIISLMLLINMCSLQVYICVFPHNNCTSLDDMTWRIKTIDWINKKAEIIKCMMQKKIEGKTHFLPEYATNYHISRFHV